ncbi:hypothetical protein ARMGADRAFT_1037790 [Armillaria gallica]|uniref:Uncharacterized protein n=1 Tax=Armillaria gallica TaxID=47427 RepID=A0A2H3CQF1_ARMGA|nr:hypothetical protein ARMGADRAFT_1037790 [Armillaria gallica]
MPTQIVQKVELLNYTVDDFVLDPSIPVKTSTAPMSTKYTFMQDGTGKGNTPVNSHGNALLPGFFLSTLAFTQSPQPQAIQPYTVRPEELFAQATLPEFAEQSWSSGGDTRSWVIKVRHDSRHGPSDRGDSSSSPAVGTKRKGLDTSDSLTDVEAHIIQKSRLTDPGEIVGSNKGKESVDGVDCGTDIISAEGLSPNKKMWQGRLPPAQDGRSWQGTTHLWISNMQQILSGMTPDQLQDANRLCPFPVKRRLILQDLGFMDGDEAELDFRFSLCDIGTWTIYPIAVINMCCIYNLVCSKEMLTPGPSTLAEAFFDAAGL